MDLAPIVKVTHKGLQASCPDTVYQAHSITKMLSVGAGPSPPAHALSYERPRYKPRQGYSPVRKEISDAGEIKTITDPNGNGPSRRVAEHLAP